MRKLLLSASLFLAAPVLAQNGVRLGEPDFRGNGCNRGSASAAISTDGQTLSILFDDYIVEAGGNSRARQDRKACNVIIPVLVPNGHSVAVFKVDYRGFVSVPQDGEAQFNVDYHFGPRAGPRLVQRFAGPTDRDFITNNNLTGADVQWSPCGRPFNLKAHSALIVRTNQQRDQVMAAVDSADVQAGLVYHLQWRRCTR